MNGLFFIRKSWQNTPAQLIRFFLSSIFLTSKLYYMKDVMLILHFLGLAMGLGTSFAFMFLGIAGSKLDPPERLKFGLNILALTRMGQIGIVLLVLSGGYLMTPHWSYLMDSPLLLAKLILVVLLIILIIVLTNFGKTAKSENSASHLALLGKTGRIGMLVAVAIVILAVLHFG